MTGIQNYSWYSKPEHKALWDKYEPANLAIRLAGWESVTHAFSNSDAVQLQRFGRGDEICPRSSPSIWSGMTSSRARLETRLAYDAGQAARKTALSVAGGWAGAEKSRAQAVQVHVSKPQCQESRRSCDRPTSTAS
jgi:hypothetical protein